MEQIAQSSAKSMLMGWLEGLVGAIFQVIKVESLRYATNCIMQ